MIPAAHCLLKSAPNISFERSGISGPFMQDLPLAQMFPARSIRALCRCAQRWLRVRWRSLIKSPTQIEWFNLRSGITTYSSRLAIARLSHSTVIARG
jgi:hypothetical protein